jgi:uncharacterized membrane protein (UPF0127 family)
MMETLQSKSRNQELVKNLRVASQMWSRMKGLLGTQELPEGQALWIHQCNSIHTFFMNYTIDCVFLDKKMKVVSLVENVVPWRMVMPKWGADSVVELPAGQIAKLKIQIGEELYVGN